MDFENILQFKMLWKEKIIWDFNLWNAINYLALVCCHREAFQVLMTAFPSLLSLLLVPAHHRVNIASSLLNFTTLYTYFILHMCIIWEYTYDVCIFIKTGQTHYNVCPTGLANNQHIRPGLDQQTCCHFHHNLYNIFGFPRVLSYLLFTTSLTNFEKFSFTEMESNQWTW